MAIAERYRPLHHINMVNAKVANTPLEFGVHLVKANPNDRMCDIKLYQELVGSLNHLAVFTRPDIAFAVSMLSQFNSNPTQTHWKAALRVLRYLKFTRNFCITYTKAFNGSKIVVFGFSDADWGSNPVDRISITGYVFMINGGPVSWTSHKQSAVALLTMESEYMALSDASRECIARSQFLEEHRRYKVRSGGGDESQGVRVPGTCAAACEVLPGHPAWGQLGHPVMPCSRVAAAARA